MKGARVTLNPTGCLSVLSHPISWDLLSPLWSESVNPRGAVDGRDTVRPGVISEVYVLLCWPLQGGKKKSAFLATDAGEAEPG